MGLCDSRPGSASGSGTRVEDERRARQRCQQTNATANGVDHHHQLHQQLQNGSTVQPLGPLRSLLIRPASHMRGEIPLTFTLEVEALPSTPTPGIIGIPPTEGISTPVRRGLSPETVSRLIDEELEASKLSLQRVVKMLLLGPSESGKSTLFKQFRIIHLNGFPRAELLAKRPIIYCNVIEAMHQLLQAVRRFNLPMAPDEEEAASIVCAISCVNYHTLEAKIPDAVQRGLKLLWESNVVQRSYQRKNEFYMLDSAKYFLDSLDRIVDREYCPSTRDILMARTITIGATEMRYLNKNYEIRLFDVGGQKSERRKWMHIFDNVHAVIFVAAISEYCQKMREDDTKDRLHDSIELFRSIGNNPIFAMAQLVLFLNKRDLFEEKLRQVPLKSCFPDYKCKNDFKNAGTYVKKLFGQLDVTHKLIYAHFTCATDTEQIEFLTNSITDMVFSENCVNYGIKKT